MKGPKLPYDSIDIKDIDDLVDLQKEFDLKGHWIYRGQKDSKWNLETSFDRMYRESNGTFSRTTSEIALIKRFQRESHHYGITNIDILNIPEWLSLMQHYGAPTRLLDWTHSFWVGLFFAIIDLPKPQDKKTENYCSLWVADWKAIDNNTPKEIKKLYENDHNLINIDNFIKTVKLNGVVKLNSFKQNERQIIQQGTFLFPLNVEETFEDNWVKNLKKGGLMKINIPFGLKRKIVQRLYRMNISFTTLYPGIEGFSRSLGHLHNIDNILKLETNIKNYSGYKKKFKVE